MGMVSLIDDAVQARCTKFSHALQRATGLTCYFVARLGTALAATDLIANAVNYYFRFLPSASTLFDVVICALLLFGMVQRSNACHKADEKLGDNVKPAELRPYTGGRFDAFWRVLWVFFSVVFLPMMFYYKPLFLSFVQNEAFQLGVAIFYNFVNVTPMPPGSNKVREWVKGLFAKRVLVPQENS